MKTSSIKQRGFWWWAALAVFVLAIAGLVKAVIN